MKILKITSNDYELKEGYIYIPYNSRELIYTIKVETTTPLTIDFFKVSFLDSVNGFKYKLTTLDVQKETETLYNFNFIIDYQSSEKANIDFIELSIFGVVNDNLKYKIKPINLKNNSTTFIYNNGTNSIVSSNLLSLRTKISSPSWSTVRKNTYSNTIKILDSLHSTFNSSYFKVNEYMRQAYSNNTEYSFSRVLLTNRPTTVLRYKNNTPIELIETSEINSTVKELNITPIQNTLDLITVILEAYSENKEEIEELNKVLPLPLFLKNNKASNGKYETCVITGYDENDERIIESILVRTDTYIKTRNTFSFIEDIKCASSTIEVTNYVDLNSNPFVINNSFIIPPIPDSDFKTFKPLIKKQSTKEFEHNTINIYNPISEKITEEFKFSLNEKNVQINSVYVTEDLDIIYTYYKDNTTIINYGKLGIDFSKNIYNSITNNNNEFISVSDINTSIGDWADIDINTTNWSNKVKDESFILQIKNKDKLYYYDILSKSLTTDKVINYTQTLPLDKYSFSINIENDSPYFITLMDSSLKNKVSCSTIDNVIIPYKIDSIPGKSDLILYKNELYSYNTISSETILTPKDEDLTVLIEWNGYSTLDYNLKFDDYFISNSDTNINEDNYKYITKDNSYNIPVVIKIDVSKFESDFFLIGTGFNINNGILNNDTTCTLTMFKNGIKKIVQLNPKQIDAIVDKFEYKVKISDLTVELLNDY